MGIQIQTDSTTNNINMKAFVAVSALLATAAADQSSHQVVKHGNAPAVKVAVHKPHGAYHATVSSQPHAAPQDVHNPYAGEKYSAAVHAPAHIPVHKPAPYHPAPVYKPAPVPHPAPVYKPAPVYHPAPVHKPAPYVAPAVHQFGYAVHDDYAKTDFAANENRDGYATNGEYRVNLPDGRTQIVTYNVADAYGGYVADVRYEGVAQYPEYHPAKPAYAPKPAPYHA